MLVVCQVTGASPLIIGRRRRQEAGDRNGIFLNNKLDCRGEWNGIKSNTADLKFLLGATLLLLLLYVCIWLYGDSTTAGQSVSKTDSREVIRQSFGRVQKCNGFARINVLINGGSNLCFL